MHDPDVLVFDVKFRIPIIDKHIYLLDVWHSEPHGHDSGTVCKGMGSTELSIHNVRWSLRHRKHLRYTVWPIRSAHRWLFSRCSDCGLPFRGNYKSRHGYMGSDEVYHDHCMTIRAYKGEAELYARFIADGSDEWAANYHAKNRVRAAAQ